jgi:spore photoproduct lyase
MTAPYSPEKVFIDSAALSYPLTRKILEKLPDVQAEVVPDATDPAAWPALGPDPAGEGKKYLHLAVQKGGFIKPCPCTPGYIGCNYFIVNAGLNCPLDCTYCILQDYLAGPFVTVFVNLDDLWRQLDAFIARLRGGTCRIGTGELTDSLVLDPLTELSRNLVSYFRDKPGVTFELKTKTANVGNVLACEPAENIVVSWSLNAPTVAATEEKGAPPVEERLEAAREVAGRGFPVGFHFDPIIRFPGWEEEYALVIDELFLAVPAFRVRWISLGSLRFPPSLKAVIRRRFPATRILQDEFIRGRDGKFRYFKPIRLELYRKIVGMLTCRGGNSLPLYFCMEDEELWREVLKKRPGGKEDVGHFLSTPVCQVIAKS